MKYLCHINLIFRVKDLELARTKNVSICDSNGLKKKPNYLQPSQNVSAISLVTEMEQVSDTTYYLF